MAREAGSGQIPEDKCLFAAIDLGSNSFHMIVGSWNGNGFRVIRKVRSVVRLAAGIDKDGRLDPSTKANALSTIREFGLHIGNVIDSNKKAVGTSGMRRIRDGGRFQAEVSKILGIPVEVISGKEEARLINLGVSCAMGMTGDIRLVVDIGGGSTEIIAGKDREVLASDSLPIGCVIYSKLFFDSGKITRAQFRDARESALEVLNRARDGFRGLVWTTVIGTSGTIKAAKRVITSNGWGGKTITPEAVDKVIDAMIANGNMENLHAIGGLSDDRVPVFPGGIAILGALMSSFSISRMTVAKPALREGIIFDLAAKVGLSCHP